MTRRVHSVAHTPDVATTGPCQSHDSGSVELGLLISSSLNYVPCFAFGLPVSWISPWDVSYYTGVAVDVNGKLINPNPSYTFKGVAIDANDPPLYRVRSIFFGSARIIFAERA